MIKRALTALATTLIGTPGSASQGEGAWVLAVGTRATDAYPDGSRVVYRFRNQLPPSSRRLSYPARMAVSWSYESADGMPSQAEREAMERVENLLAPHVGPTSVLVLVSTGAGLREWVYYTASETDFTAGVNEALRGPQHLPITIVFQHDPKWTFYEQLKRSVQD